MRHLLLSGGPGHDFDGSAAVLVDLVADAETTVVTEPGAAVEALRRAAAGVEPPWDLLTVHALRWRMEVERYAHLRDAEGFDLTDADARVIADHVAGGGGLLALHTAVICFDAQPRWRDLLGAAWDWDRSHHRAPGPVAVAVTDVGRAHPVTAGTDPFEVVDELYADLDRSPDVVALLEGARHDQVHPVLWARTHGAGRVVVDVLGHDPASLVAPAHRAVLGRAVTWAARTTADDAPGPRRRARTP